MQCGARGSRVAAVAGRVPRGGGAPRAPISSTCNRRAALVHTRSSKIRDSYYDLRVQAAPAALPLARLGRVTAPRTSDADPTWDASVESRRPRAHCTRSVLIPACHAPMHLSRHGSAPHFRSGRSLLVALRCHCRPAPVLITSPLSAPPSREWWQLLSPALSLWLARVDLPPGSIELPLGR